MRPHETWNLPAPPGFQGLRDDLPLRVYYRLLPHWRQAGATYFVTFRLADSLPKNERNELESIKREWHARHPHPTKAELQEFTSTTMLRIDSWLDQGCGECVLKSQAVVDILVEAFHHFDAKHYSLGAFVIMPNHVHMLVRPFDDDEHALERVLQSRKRHTATRINELLGKTGTLWQEESFDRIVRDEEHLYRCLQYIGDNPRRAGLPSGFYRWVSPSWRAAGWDFVDPRAT